MKRSPHHTERTGSTDDDETSTTVPMRREAIQTRCQIAPAEGGVWIGRLFVGRNGVWYYNRLESSLVAIYRTLRDGSEQKKRNDEMAGWHDKYALSRAYFSLWSALRWSPQCAKKNLGMNSSQERMQVRLKWTQFEYVFGVPIQFSTLQWTVIQYTQYNRGVPTIPIYL